MLRIYTLNLKPQALYPEKRYADEDPNPKPQTSSPRKDAVLHGSSEEVGP